MAAASYLLLQRAIILSQGPGSLLAEAVGRDVKGKSTLALYVIAILAAFIQPWISAIIWVCIPLIWLIPDRRIERAIENKET